MTKLEKNRKNQNKQMQEEKKEDKKRKEDKRNVLQIVFKQNTWLVYKQQFFGWR